MIIYMYINSSSTYVYSASYICWVTIWKKIDDAVGYAEDVK